MDIRKQTKELMKARGWSQGEVAQKAGIHPVTLSRLLANPRPPKTAYDKLILFLEQNQTEAARE